MAIRPGHIPGTVFEPGERKSRHFVYRVSIDGRDREVTLYAADAAAAVRAAGQAFERLGQGREPGGPPAGFTRLSRLYAEAAAVSADQLRYLARLESHFGNRDPATIRGADIARAARQLYPGAAPATWNRQAVAPAAAVLHFAHEQGWLPWLRVRRFAETPPGPRRPRAGAIDALLEATSGDQRRLILVLACQGWRITETLGLEWQRLDLAAGTASLYVRKARRWRAVPLHPAVRQDLAGAPKDSGPVFPWRDRHQVYKWLRPLCEELEVSFTPHQARHEFAARLREAGATPRDLVDVGSWTSEKATGAYDAAAEPHKHAVLARLEAPGGAVPAKRKVKR